MTLRNKFEQNKAQLDRDTTDPFYWWQDQGLGAILVLCPLARMYLAIPASTADVERTWSSAQYLSVSRHSLLPKNLERQMVIRDWILELVRTHGDGTQAFKDAVNTFVQSLGRTEVPDSDREESAV